MAHIEELRSAMEEAILLGDFKSFCEKNSSVAEKTRLRKIYNNSRNVSQTTKNVIENELRVSVAEENIERLTELIIAFINKSDYRRTIPEHEKKELLMQQKNKCGICGCDIDLNAHADHIVPFKYVGDELKNNLQMLCADCNLKKNASIDYQIRFYLHLV